MTDMPPPGIVLGRLDALSNPGAFPSDYEPLPILLVRKGEAAFAYVNVCPHQGRPLCLPSGRTLVSEGAFIVCPFHGASFAIETGACTGGPAGKAGLKPVPVEVRDGQIITI
ncbi:MAG: Rieske (2Fe-2S) protein [Caulobacterales bacterium]|uniref:Rieske (2Fe-2S) protein n=1 Tax=Glycocaulis sp. TaxID=1969725 RepID=UPI003FA047A6